MCVLFCETGVPNVHVSVLVILSSTKNVDFGSNHSLAPYDCILPREFKQFPSYNASCQDKPSHMILRQFRKILHLVVVDVGKKARARRLEWVRHLEPWTIKQPSLLKIFMTQKYLWQICLQSVWHISASGFCSRSYKSEWSCQKYFDWTILFDWIVFLWDNMSKCLSPNI